MGKQPSEARQKALNYYGALRGTPKQKVAVLVGGLCGFATGVALAYLLPQRFMLAAVIAGFAVYIAVAWVVLHFDGGMDEKTRHAPSDAAEQPTGQDGKPRVATTRKPSTAANIAALCLAVPGTFIVMLLLRYLLPVDVANAIFAAPVAGVAIFLLIKWIILHFWADDDEDEPPVKDEQGGRR